MKPLNPIMAVLAIASLGVFPLRTLAVDGVVIPSVPVGVPVKAEGTDSLTRLTDILDKNRAAEADAGRRIADFLLLDFLLPPDTAKKSFVAADVVVKELRAAALVWADKQKPGDLAMLYLVVGVGSNPPDWVKNDDLLANTVLLERNAEGLLRNALKQFANPATEQIKRAGGVDASNAFLNLALTKAHGIFKEPRSMAQVTSSSNANDNTGVKVPTGSPKPVPPLGASQQYTMKELYLEGGEVEYIAGAKDKLPQKISIKIYTRRDPVKGLVNEIGIFDISDENNIFGQRFPAGEGDQSFILDDRKPGNRRYELKFKTLPGGDRQVVFGRPGEGGKKIDTTVSTLYNKRADQVARLDKVVTVGGQEFYVAPQGGKMGALPMYPKGLIDSRRGPGMDPRDLEPKLYAEVSTRDADGRNQNAPAGTLGGPHLGTVGGKDYRLEFNAANGFWEVKEGPGNLPPPKPKASTTGDNPTNPGALTSGDPAESSSDDLSLAEVMIKVMAEFRDCEPGDTSKLKTEELKKTFDFVTCNKNKPEGLHVTVVVPSSIHRGRQVRYTRSATDDGKPPMNLLEGRMIDHYLVLKFDREVHYLDLRKPTGVNTPVASFELASFVIDGKMGSDAKLGFKNMAIFEDALRKYMGVTGQDKDAFVQVPDRMAKMFGSKPFNYIQASYRDDGGVNRNQLVVNGHASGGAFEVWPDVKPPKGETGPASSQYAKLSGPANAMDRIVSSEYTAIRSTMPLAKSMKGVAIHSVGDKADIAIYQSTDPTDLTGKSDPNQYFVVFNYDALDPNPANLAGPKVKRTFHQTPFEVFNASNPLPLKGLQFQGLVGQTVITSRGAAGYRFITGSNAERGVLAVFEEKSVSGENVKDKPANCVGPIIWWGYEDRAAALKVCQKDKF